MYFSFPSIPLVAQLLFVYFLLKTPPSLRLHRCCFAMKTSLPTCSPQSTNRFLFAASSQWAKLINSLSWNETPFPIKYSNSIYSYWNVGHKFIFFSPATVYFAPRFLVLVQLMGKYTSHIHTEKWMRKDNNSKVDIRCPGGRDVDVFLLFIAKLKRHID